MHRPWKSTTPGWHAGGELLKIQFFVDNLRIWVPILAIFALSAPVRGQETKAPDGSTSRVAGRGFSALNVNGHTLKLIAQHAAPKRDAGTVQPEPPNPTQKSAQTAAPNENPDALPDAPEPVQIPPAVTPEEPTGHIHPRVLGLKPRLGVIDPGTPVVTLTAQEKFSLFLEKTYPWQFLSSAIGAGIGQARDSLPGYGQGAEGYGKRYGANFSDSSIAAFISDFALPSVLHEDPRYYRMGSGNPTMHRVVHAAMAEFYCHRDDGTTGFAYGKVGGKFIATTIGNAYYPDNDRGVGVTFERGALLLASGMGHKLFDEFWPDIHAKVKHKKVSQSTASDSTVREGKTSETSITKSK